MYVYICDIYGWYSWHLLWPIGPGFLSLGSSRDMHERQPAVWIFHLERSDGVHPPRSVKSRRKTKSDTVWSSTRLFRKKAKEDSIQDKYDLRSDWSSFWSLISHHTTARILSIRPSLYRTESSREFKGKKERRNTWYRKRNYLPTTFRRFPPLLH